MQGHAQRVKRSQQKSLCLKDQAGCRKMVAGDSANRSRRTRVCRELATLVTGLSLPFAQWPVVSNPFLLLSHLFLHLISLFPCPAFSSPPLLLHLPAFPTLFLSQPLPNKSKDQPAICFQPSARPVCIPRPSSHPVSVSSVPTTSSLGYLLFCLFRGYTTRCLYQKIRGHSQGSHNTPASRSQL